MTLTPAERLGLEALLARPAVQKLRSALSSDDFDQRTYLVGGCVRDALFGLPQSNDLDLVTTAPIEKLMQHLDASGIGEHPPAIFAAFGTAKLTIDGVEMEFVHARAESYRGDSRKPDVRPATLEEDALRRDLTLNALMLRVADRVELLDLTQRGLDDLRRRVARVPIEPRQSFLEDALRLLRLVRFRHRFGLQWAPGLAEAVSSQAHRLQTISAERITVELFKMSEHESAADAWGELLELGLVDYFAPELRAMDGCTQPDAHHLDVWQHTLLALQNAKDADLITKLGVLFHDVGKPPTKSIDPGGRIRFLGHEKVGAELTRAILLRWRTSHEIADRVARLVANHMRFTSTVQLSTSAARRVVRVMEEDMGRLLELVDADQCALRPGFRPLDMAQIREHIATVAEQAKQKPLESPLSGREIIDLLGIEPGVIVGKIKAALLEEVLEGRIEAGDREAAIHFLNKNRGTLLG